LPIIIREYRDEDFPQVAAIWSLAFRGGDPLLPDDRVASRRDATIYVAEDEEGIVGAAKILKMRITLRGGASVAAGGVSAVGVAPEHRGQGVGSAMLHWLAGQMRREKFVISMLHAMREGYYRQFGYEVCGHRHLIRCPIGLLPRMESDLPIQRLTMEDWGEIAPVYEAFARRYSGMAAREDLYRSRIHNSEGTLPLVYAVGSPPQAYAILRLNRGRWERPHEDQPIAELAWATPRGYRELLGALGLLCINTRALVWCEPGDSPFLALHVDRGVEAERLHLPTYRVLDVAAALGGLEATAGAGEGNFTFALKDELLPANGGPWRVAFGAGRVEIGPMQDEEPDFRMSIGAFSQALLGEPDLRALAGHGAVEVGNAAGFEAACRFLPPFPAYCMEYF
jgi:predicted acetyltransferase